MTYRGHVENGVVVIDDPDAIPEGMEVRVEPLKRLTIAERLKDFIGCA